MSRINICDLVAQYGANNLRFFIEDVKDQGYFRNPFAGLREYSVTSRYDPTKRHKIGLGLVERNRSDVMPEWFEPIMNERSFYISDLESLMDQRPGFCRIYVLVDHDDKYQQLV